MTTRYEITARYAETDQMGVIHHSVYPIWFEQARTEHMKQWDVFYAVMEKEGVLLPVWGLQCQYHQPIYYDERVCIRTSTTTLTPARIYFSYELWNETSKLACTASTYHAFTTRELRPINLKKTGKFLYHQLEKSLIKSPSSTRFSK